MNGVYVKTRYPLRMDMRKLVGRNFARLRRAKGLTQEEVEARSGFSQQYLSSLERGRRNPTVITLYELAQALGVSHVNWLSQTTISADRRIPRGSCFSPGRHKAAPLWDQRSRRNNL